MSIIPIRLYGDPILRRKTLPIEKFNELVTSISSDLLDTLQHAEALGLAAPQIGYSYSIIAINTNEELSLKEPLVLVNPTIKSQQGRQTEEEGCLSLPEIIEKVTRPERIIVDAVTSDGQPIKIDAEQLLARVLSHEIDHLDGILFIDRLSTVKQQLIRKKLKQLKQQINS